jgi:alpha-L-fucosidase
MTTGRVKLPDQKTMLQRVFYVLLLSSLIYSCAFAAEGQNSFANETPAQRDARMTWWREARFGMFIHYGPVALTGREISWSRANSNPKCPNKGPTPVEVYDNLYKNFNPTNFNANEWAGVAKMAGMKYVVLTAKHCDGFLLWDSKVDSYNMMATPYKHDLCAELAKAVRHQGLRLGWYFSPMDWRDPDFRTERNDAFVARMQGELKELFNNYGRIDLVWFDFDGREAPYDQANTYAIVKRAQPKIVMDNRLDLGLHAKNTEMKSPLADYYTPEQQIGAYDDVHPWETCMTLGTQWSWKPDDKIKSAAETIGILARTAGGDGNLLLDVGPMPDGRIEPRQVEVLKQVGAWMDRNGQSIYGTRGGPFKPSEFGTSTRKGRTIYVHVLKWPDGALKLPSLPGKIVGAKILGNGGSANVRETVGRIEITVAPEERDASDTVVALKFDRDVMGFKAVEVK